MSLDAIYLAKTNRVLVPDAQLFDIILMKIFQTYYRPVIDKDYLVVQDRMFTIYNVAACVETAYELSMTQS